MPAARSAFLYVAEYVCSPVRPIKATSLNIVHLASIQTPANDTVVYIVKHSSMEGF